jgi:hypothetical protein
MVMANGRSEAADLDEADEEQKLESALRTRYSTYKRLSSATSVILMIKTTKTKPGIGSPRQTSKKLKAFEL